VKELRLVVNYDVPNHHEDYVHRVGRTGRAGNKGTAVTFIAPDEEKYAPDLVKALTESGKPIPYALQEMADEFQKKFKQGLVKARGSGFGGSGYKFDEEEENEKMAARKAVMKQHGHTLAESDDDDDDSDGDGKKKKDGKGKGKEGDDEDDDIKVTRRQQPGAQPPPHQQQQQSKGNQGQGAVVAEGANAALVAKLLAAAKVAARQVELEAGFVNPANALLPRSAMMSAAAAGATGSNQLALAIPGGVSAGAPEEVYSTEIEINDFPQKARWLVTQKREVFRMGDEYNVAITPKGSYFPPGKQPRDGERKLYLLIEGPMERGVKMCKSEIKKTIQEATEKALISGRYNL